MREFVLWTLWKTESELLLWHNLIVQGSVGRQMLPVKTIWVTSPMINSYFYIYIYSLFIFVSNFQVIPFLMVPHMTVKLIGIIFIVISALIGTAFLIIAGAWIAVMIFTTIYVFWVFLETYFLLVLRAHYLDVSNFGQVVSDVIVVNLVHSLLTVISFLYITHLVDV